MTLDEMLTAAEAAERKGVTADAIQRACRDGRLPAIRRGGVYLIRESDLADYNPVHKPARSGR